MPRQSARSGLTFFGAVGFVMAALKLKQKMDDYNEVLPDEEGRVALTDTPYRDGPSDDDTRIGLLDTEILPTTRPKRKRAGCCVCCGLNCTLFWKAFGIVLAVFAVWNAFKLIRWAVTDAPTGLELMPAYGTSFGCLTAPYIYNSSKTVFTAPIGTHKHDHSFDIRGDAVGTFVLAQGATDSQEVKYEVTIRTDDEMLLQQISVQYPETDDDGSITDSRVLISTPTADSASSACMRYDIKMYVPPNLKKLHVASHSPMHVQFDSDSKIELDNLFITMFSISPNNMILPHQGLRSNTMALEVYRGWIVGDVLIMNSTSITSQRGDGVVNVHAHPAPPANLESPETAYLRTTTGAGRSDIFYVTSKAFKRPINNVHISSRNADVYLTYREAEYSGRIELDSRSFSATGLHPYIKAPPSIDEGGSGREQKWTHWVGNQDGSDMIYIKSRGWTGLYF